MLYIPIPDHVPEDATRLFEVYDMDGWVESHERIEDALVHRDRLRGEARRRNHDAAWVENIRVVEKLYWRAKGWAQECQRLVDVREGGCKTFTVYLG